MTQTATASSAEHPQDVTGIVRAAAAGDADAFRSLYELHARGIYNMVLRSVREPRAAEDLCQVIWMKAHRQLPKLREPAAFSLWLYRIAAKGCIDASRRRGRRPAAQPLDEAFADAAPGPEAEAMRREDGRIVWEALAALPAKQHLALFLREAEGRSYEEIAAVLKTSVTAVGLSLMRGRRALARAYDRLSSAPASERCRQAQATMAVLIDGEADAVQRRGVLAHVDGCRPCERDLRAMRRASHGYAALALAPVPALLSGRILAQTAAAAGLAGSGAGGGTLAAMLAPAKSLALAATVAGGLTAAAVLTPGPAPARHATPPPAAAVPAPTAGAGASSPLPPRPPATLGAVPHVPPLPALDPAVLERLLAPALGAVPTLAAAVVASPTVVVAAPPALPLPTIAAGAPPALPGAPPAPALPVAPSLP